MIAFLTVMVLCLSFLFELCIFDNFVLVLLLFVALGVLLFSFVFWSSYWALDCES